VDAHNLRAAFDGEDVCGNRGSKPVVNRRAAGQLAQEALARSAEQERVAQRSQLVEAANERGVLRYRLAEADAGVDDSMPAGDAGAAGQFECAVQLGAPLKRCLQQVQSYLRLDAGCRGGAGRGCPSARGERGVLLPVRPWRAQVEARLPGGLRLLENRKHR